ncbi:polymorphic toxin-type HINT domain-containing protein [Phytohabitans rumicis]|nr:polymorphic toxin-type HINT domain-containing protein [Phytohabitans rumicis]
MRARLAALTVLTLLVGFLYAVPARAQDEPEPVDRSMAVNLWRSGGVQVRVAAESALIGSDDQVRAFLDGGWQAAQRLDERDAVARAISEGGPAVRAAAKQALDAADAGDPDAIGRFLASGWQGASDIDARVTVNQLMAAGGPQVREVAQEALDSNDPEALRAFADSGWQAQWLTDQRLRVNQAVAIGGPQVKAAGQRALDAGTPEALEQFLEYGWAVASARDDEVATLTDLAAQAEAAGALAAAETQAAKDDGARAKEAAEGARRAAAAAAQATEDARDNAAQAGEHAKRAAFAAEQAAQAARVAVQAAAAASRAARAAANAAARTAAAAAKAGDAAARARKAAADAATDETKAAQARTAAENASAAAEKARDLAGTAAAASEAIGAGLAAIDAAKSAAHNANLAAAANDEAVAAANAAGANTSEAVAAAQRARDNAARATRAAEAAERYLRVAIASAIAARDAANRAAENAQDAAEAAIEAAEHAGEAAEAAGRATAHAEAATLAAQDAVNAATQAVAVFQAARQADDERLAVAKDQALEAARAGRTQYEAQQQIADWDAEEATKRTAETNRLLALARDPATPPAEAVAAGRRVALSLAGAQGTYTREAALAALGGSDAQILLFVHTGLPAANARDDRQTVMDLAVTDNAALSAAARTALDGTDADVRTFLRTQNYPGRFTKDRVKVNQIMAAARTAGDTVLMQRAQEALDAGTLQALRDFLDTGRFVAAAVGERVRVNQLLADPTSGPELKAAAQVALDGPPTALREFLQVGRYAAAERDHEGAAHLAIVGGLLERINQAAESAMQHALEAQAVAAQAHGDAQLAADYANQAAASAEEAAEAAERADAYADDAARSVEKAAAAVATARNAATQANASARSAVRSAAWAIASNDRAVQAAKEAYDAAKRAYDSAVAANASAEAAANAAKSAYDAYIYQQQIEIHNCFEMYADSPVADLEKYMDGTKYQWFANCAGNVLADPTEMFTRAYKHGVICDGVYAPGSQGHENCTNAVFDPMFTGNLQISLLLVAVEFAKNIFLVGAAASIVGCILVLPCGLAAGALLTIGDVGLNVFKFFNGDQSLLQTLINLGAIALETLLLAGLGKLLSVGFQALKAMYLAVQGLKVAEAGLRETGNLTLLRLGGLASCLGRHSFDPGTPVLMADGTRRRIVDVKVGEQVLATDPASGRTTRERVTRVWRNRDTALTDVRVVDRAGASTTIRTTPTHPFWATAAGAWVEASALASGSRLQSRDAEPVTVTGVRSYTGSKIMYDLTVANTHTYYVIAGRAPLLVHNTGCDQVIMEAFGIRASGSVAPGRNIAVARTEIAGGIPELLSAVSGLGRRDGFVPEIGPHNPQIFIPWQVGDHNNRMSEPEFKILNYIAHQLGPSPNVWGTIVLYSERIVCPSCEWVIRQFRERYPHIELTVLTGGG